MPRDPADDRICYNCQWWMQGEHCLAGHAGEPPIEQCGRCHALPRTGFIRGGRPHTFSAGPGAPAGTYTPLYRFPITYASDWCSMWAPIRTQAKEP